jgi:hypothetical protein
MVLCIAFVRSCSRVSPSCDLNLCITFVRFDFVYHLRATCSRVLPSCDFTFQYCLSAIDNWLKKTSSSHSTARMTELASMS